MEAFGQSLTGAKHLINQDSFYIDNKNKIYIVADGMGGHAAGDVASSRAIKTISENINISSIEEALSIANKDVLEKSKTSPEFEGMGTTIAMCQIKGNTAIIANIGDSRVYIVRNNEIVFVTRDHSFVQQMIDSGQIQESEAKTHAMKNVITRALGVSESVAADIDEIELEDGDIIMICSDGVSNMLEEADIIRILTENDAEKASNALCSAAFKNGGKDDLTAVVIKL